MTKFNNEVILYFLVLFFIFLALPPALANLLIFGEVAAFSFYTVKRLGRKEWQNQAMTKQERGRAIHMIAFFALTYCFVCIARILLHPVIIEDAYDLIDMLLQYFLGILLNYLVFQVNLELNYYGNRDYSDEGLLTRIIKGRYYRQSNSTSEIEQE